MTRDYLFFMTYRPKLGLTESSIQWIMGEGDAPDHSTSSNAKVKKS
jgi:hypothetical protein